MVNKRRQLISSDEAVVATSQHTRPCSDCPWARTALNGWLGGMSIDDWLAAAHSNTYIECHTRLGVQCAGNAIYRRNTCKSVPEPLLTLPADREACFSTPDEFRIHHSKLPSGTE